MGVGDSPYRLRQHGTQVGIAFGAARLETLATALLITGSHTRPGGDVAIGGEAGHINADLAQDRGGYRAANAWDLQDGGELLLIRHQVLLNLPLQLGDLLLQAGQVVKYVA